MTDPTRFAGAPVHTVYFDFAADRLSTDELRRLDAVVEQLKGTAQPLQIRGFTDAIGFQAYNDDLALRRADSVRTALLQRGIPASRIRTSGVGRAEYVGDNRQEATRKRNRRVEIRFDERRLRSVETGPRRRDGDSAISQVADPRRVGRYSELTAVPSPGQANPLETVISVTFPQAITTVGAALHHVLARSGWQVASHAASDPTFTRLATLALPASQRALGPIALIDALALLCGEAYTVVVDPVHRLDLVRTARTLHPPGAHRSSSGAVPRRAQRRRARWPTLSIPMSDAPAVDQPATPADVRPPGYRGACAWRCWPARWRCSASPARSSGRPSRPSRPRRSARPSDRHPPRMRRSPSPTPAPHRALAGAGTDGHYRSPRSINP